jgi:hypothetical protein
MRQVSFRSLSATFALLGALALGVVAAVLVGGAPEASAATCGPAPAGKTAVVVVVDNGSSVTSKCVIVAEGTRGGNVLTAAGYSTRVEGMGFVCGIGGVPAQGCALNDPSADFWSYWHGSPGGQWEYSRAGGFSYAVRGRCAVEGWHYVPTTNRTPPRMAPPQMNCAAPTTAPAATAPPATSPPAGRPPATSPPPVNPGVEPGSGVSGGQSGEGTKGEAAGDPGGDPDTPVASGEAGAGKAGGPANSDTSDGRDAPAKQGNAEDARGSANSEVSEDDADLAADLAADAESQSGPESGSGSPAGVILVGVLMTALGVALWFQRRRWTANSQEAQPQEPQSHAEPSREGQSEESQPGD